MTQLEKPYGCVCSDCNVGVQFEDWEVQSFASPVERLMWMNEHGAETRHRVRKMQALDPVEIDA